MSNSKNILKSSVKNNSIKYSKNNSKNVLNNNSKSSSKNSSKSYSKINVSTKKINNEYIRVIEEELIRAKYYYQMKKKFEKLLENTEKLGARLHVKEDLHKEKIRKILNGYLLIPLTFKKNKVKNDDPLFITEKVSELEEQLYIDLQTYNRQRKFKKQFNKDELKEISLEIETAYWDMMEEYSKKVKEDIKKLDDIKDFDNDIEVKYNTNDKGTTCLYYTTKLGALNGITDDYISLKDNKITMNYYGYKAYGTSKYLAEPKNRVYLFASYFRYKYFYIDNQSLAYDYEHNNVGKEYKKHEVTECFSTPFNRYFDHFCSAFPDIDGHFGSLGSYFDRMREASKDKFEFPTQRLAINPPFVMNLMDLALDLALATFKKKKNSYKMSFILPSWDQDDDPFMGVRRMTEWAEKNKKNVKFEKTIAPKGSIKFKNYFVGKTMEPCDILFMKLEKI